MKNLFLFLSLMIVITLLTSCSQSGKRVPRTNVGPGVEKVVSYDTTIQIREPILETRWGCDGRWLPDPKVSGWYTDRKGVSGQTPCTVSDAELKELGYVYTGKPQNSSKLGSVTPIQEGGPETNTRVVAGDVNSRYNESWDLEWGWWMALIALILLAIMAFQLYRIAEKPAPTPTPAVSPAPGTVSVPVGGIYIGPKNPGESRHVSIKIDEYEEFPEEWKSQMIAPNPETKQEGNAKE